MDVIHELLSGKEEKLLLSLMPLIITAFIFTFFAIRKQKNNDLFALIGIALWACSFFVLQLLFKETGGDLYSFAQLLLTLLYIPILNVPLSRKFNEIMDKQKSKQKRNIVLVRVPGKKVRAKGTNQHYRKSETC